MLSSGLVQMILSLLVEDLAIITTHILIALSLIASTGASFYVEKTDELLSVIGSS
jgi:hypothetical protein